MISGKLVEALPRIKPAAVGMLLPTDTDQAAVVLEVDLDGQVLVRNVTLSATPLPRRGGMRWWWLCPRCGRRRRHLYLVEDVLCRTCARACYLSQRR